MQTLRTVLKRREYNTKRINFLDLTGDVHFAIRQTWILVLRRRCSIFCRKSKLEIGIILQIITHRCIRRSQDRKSKAESANAHAIQKGPFWSTDQTPSVDVSDSNAKLGAHGDSYMDQTMFLFYLSVLLLITPHSPLSRYCNMSPLLVDNAQV